MGIWAALGGLSLLAAGYSLGAWVARRQERALRATLDERSEKLSIAENEVLRLSALDPVTQLPTQQSVQEFLEREWRRALRSKTFISLIMIDVDHFRAYNERLGPAAGDLCLKQVAEALRTLVRRSGDLLSRYGDGEFAVVLGGVDSSGAITLATQLQAAVNALALPHPASPTADCVTVSLGLATVMPARNAEWQDIELIAKAERALSEARQTGRNRIVSELDLGEATGTTGS